MNAIQSVQSHFNHFLTLSNTQRITACALVAIGGLTLLASAALAPVLTPITGVCLLVGAVLFVAGFFMNFFVTAKVEHDTAKGIWTNQGKQLDISVTLPQSTLEIKTIFTDQYEIKIITDDALEKVVSFDEIPSMISLVDKDSQFVFEKIKPNEWLKQFKSVEVVGFCINNNTTHITLTFS